MSTNRSRRRSTFTLAGIAAGLTSVLVPSAAGASAPRQAETGETVTAAALRNGICDDGEFCVYREANNTGSVHDWGTGVDDYNYGNDRYINTTVVVEDHVKSVWNRTGCAVRIFDDNDHNGDGFTVPAGWKGNLAGKPVGNNEASSHNACV